MSNAVTGAQAPPPSGESVGVPMRLSDHRASTSSGGLRVAELRGARRSGSGHRAVLQVQCGLAILACRRVRRVVLLATTAMTTMNYRRLGSSGLKVSELSFGSWVTYGNQMGDGPRARVHGRRLRRGRQFLRQRRGLRQGRVRDDHGRGAEEARLARARPTSSRPSSSGACTTARTRRTRSTAST